MNEYDEISSVTNNEKGVTAKATAFDLAMRLPEWEDAKNGCTKNPDSAKIIISKLWTPDLSAKLATRLSSKDHVAFVTVPSTTGQNHIPDELAKTIITDLKYGTYVKGETIAFSVNTVPMKDVHRDERPFMAREYIVLDTAKALLAGHSIVIVEDVLSSGASAKAFADALKRNNFEIETVAGLIGDSRLTPEPQLINKMQKTFKRLELTSISAKDIGSILSRGQIEIVIEKLNQTRDKNERSEIARKLSGILDSRAARIVEEHSRRETHGGRGFSIEDRSNASITLGIQNQFGTTYPAVGFELHAQPREEHDSENNRIEPFSLDSIQATQRDHAHLLDTATLYTDALKTYTQAKEAQALRIESRLEKEVAVQQAVVVESRAHRPGVVSSLWRGKAWEQRHQSQAARLQILERRLERVRGIRVDMGGKRLGELARKKLLRDKPELVAKHDAEERIRRERQAEDAIQKNALRQAKERSQAQSRGRRQGIER